MLGFIFRLFNVLGVDMIEIIVKIIRFGYEYKTDEKRECEGKPMKYQRYTGSLTDESNMTEKTVKLIRESYETVRAAENERLRKQRASYVYNGDGVDMDDITAVGTIAPRTGAKNEYMDSIATAGTAPPASETEPRDDSCYEMKSVYSDY